MDLFHEELLIQRYDNKNNDEITWKIGIEYDCNIYINNKLYRNFAVSPYEIDCFITGYFLTSGKLQNMSDILDYKYDINNDDQSIIINVKMADDKYDDFLNSENLGTSQDIFTSQDIPVENMYTGAVKFSEIARNEQGNNYSLHMGCWFDEDGNLIKRCYDLSRHVALDKALGYAYTNNCHKGFLVMSSRAAFELVNKAYLTGVKNLVFMSFPTTLAINKAKSKSMNLYVYSKNKLYTITSNS